MSYCFLQFKLFCQKEVSNCLKWAISQKKLKGPKRSVFRLVVLFFVFVFVFKYKIKQRQVGEKVRNDSITELYKVNREHFRYLDTTKRSKTCCFCCICPAIYWILLNFTTSNTRFWSNVKCSKTAAIFSLIAYFYMRSLFNLYCSVGKVRNDALCIKTLFLLLLSSETFFELLKVQNNNNNNNNSSKKSGR